MIPKECKRLAEVDFPIAVVSKQAAREKSIRHGHPSTLHLWWARRPLAACRAILLGLLLPDPCDPHCPEDFKKQARELLPKVQGKVGPKDEDIGRALLHFIGEFSNWDLSSDRTFLEVSRGLVKAAHPEETPLVVDPFAGGGSIPLEALRLGCETFASDLNPVACLILKVMLEDIPRHGPELADELRRVGKEIKEAAESELKKFYPDDTDGSKPITYLWARTVNCEAPNCGSEIPLVRSFWLCKKANRKRALRHKVVRPPNGPPHVEFEIFEPKADKDVHGGTVTRAKATCLCCGTVLPPERVRAQLVEQSGGADVIFGARGNRTGGARMLAVVTLREGEAGRQYRNPSENDYNAVWKAQRYLNRKLDEWKARGEKVLCPVPNEELPLMSGTFNVPLYGMRKWGNLFSARQKIALLSLSFYVSKTSGPLRDLLSIAVDRSADGSAAITGWLATGEEIKHVFSRQALPMVWDFGESNYFADASRSWESALNAIEKVLLTTSQTIRHLGQVQPANACQHPLPNDSVSVFFTDPPYYFAVPYADLSDFFFVWMKRSMPDHPLVKVGADRDGLTPKAQELCEMSHWDSRRYSHKDQNFFEDGMKRAFSEGRRILHDDGIGAIVFAHKTTEGWEALLSGLIQAGWVVTASWPIATEAGNRLRARDSAALATSVHLVCRPRPDNAPVGDWSKVLHELPMRVGDWMERLQGEGIRGADLVFACIGPALEIFSRYPSVETAESREVKLAEYLEKVWEVVGHTALEQILGTTEARARNGLAGALEEDARLTALFLWTLQSTNGEGESQKEKGKNEEIEEEVEIEDDEEEKPKKKKAGFSLVFDVVRRFAQPLGIHLPEWEGRIIETEKGVVRLLSIQERAKSLFGEDGAQTVADRLESSRGASPQLMLFPQARQDAPLPIKGRKKRPAGDVPDEALRTQRGATTLDRVHAAMLLQANGRANALRALLKDEQERGPDFLRLANALSALYPKESEEKRLLDAMLLAMPR